MWKRTLSLVALAITVLMVTAACSNSAAVNIPDTAPVDDHATEDAQTVVPSGEADRVVEVELSEFAIAADNLKLVPGETVEFIVTNSGVAQHEFRLSNQDRVDEHIAGGHEDHDDGTMSDEEMAAMDDESDDHEDDGQGEEAEDVLLIVEAGETGTILFSVPDNDHDYTAAVCLIPGHYEAGMATNLSYEA